jgi:tetratricopeptide (TPR) repeat protein
MLGAALEHTDPLKWIDGWQLLDEGRRQDRALLTLGAAQNISRGRQARYFVEGVVRGANDSTVVVLRLHDAVGDSLIAQETVVGSAGTPAYQLGLAAVRRLLPRLLDPGRAIDLAPLSDRRPAAIALWIQGEREYRRGRFAPALEFYERAVREDSSLVFAAAKGAQAASWIHSPSQARALIELAVARGTLLPQRYRDFARGLEAYLSGDADTAVVWLERALAGDRQWEEAWTALGQVFHQLFPSRVPLDSLAEAAFASAVAADSDFTPPMFHLIDIAVRRGELDRARMIMARLRRAEADSTLQRRSAILLECLSQGPKSADGNGDGRGNLRALLSAAKALAVAGAQTECAETAFRRVLAATDSVAYRWAALVGLQGLLAAQSRVGELTTLLDSAVAAGTSQALWLYSLDADAGLPVESQAAQMEAFARQRYGDGYRGAAPHTQWLLGIWHARRGNVSTVEALHRALAARVADPGARLSLLAANALAGHLALARGDTTDAIDKLRGLRPTAVSDSLSWSLWEPLPIERLTLARLLFARGRYQEAHDVAGVFDHQQPIAFLPFLAPSLALRLKAAEALGRPGLVAEYRARLLKLGRTDLVGSP